MDNKVETKEHEKINDSLTDDAMLRQIAEEAAELTQAALKMVRVISQDSPTPMTPETALLNILEEIADVCLCADVFLANKADGAGIVEKIKNEKLTRWAERIGYDFQKERG